MDSDGLPAIGRGVDLNKIPSIPQKRTVAFVNHYLSRSVQLLNEISAAAERQLEKALEQIQQLDAGVCILEGKLDSIPGLTDGITLEPELDESRDAKPTEVVTAQPSARVVPSSEVEATQTDIQGGSSSGNSREDTDRVRQSSESSHTPSPEEAAGRSVLTYRNDPRYKKYFTMIAVGIPKPAVQQKMLVEGVDLSILEKGDQPAPPPDTDEVEPA